MTPEVKAYCIEYAHAVAQKQTEFLQTLRASIEKGEISAPFARQCVRIAQIDPGTIQLTLRVTTPKQAIK